MSRPALSLEQHCSTAACTAGGTADGAAQIRPEQRDPSRAALYETVLIRNASTVKDVADPLLWAAVATESCQVRPPNTSGSVVHSNGPVRLAQPYARVNVLRRSNSRLECPHDVQLDI